MSLTARRFQDFGWTTRLGDATMTMRRCLGFLFCCFFFSVILLTHIYVCLSNRRAHISKLHGRTLHHQLAQVKWLVSLTPPNLHVDVAFLVSLAWTAIICSISEQMYARNQIITVSLSLISRSSTIFCRVPEMRSHNFLINE